MKSTPLAVRKGAWTKEEDVILTKYIVNYGEGKWHQVPLRAGLNRCRKSCRLRWLNYLRPDIKRGEFKTDEVDLIIRLHKLLGNRWSLIAGRLPGRTANDVKNYWNTHLLKKQAAHREDPKPKDHKTTKANIIKPRPRSFSENLPWSRDKNVNLLDKNIPMGENLSNPSQMSPPILDDTISWWNKLLVDNEVGDGAALCFSESEEEHIMGLWADERSTETKAGESVVQEAQNGWTDFAVDMDIWDLLSSNNPYCKSNP